MLPLQECPHSVLSVALTAKEHGSYSIFWSSHTPEVPLSWLCRSASKGTVGLGRVSGTVMHPWEHELDWQGEEGEDGDDLGESSQAGRRISVIPQSDLCVHTDEGENSVPLAFCVF